MVAFHFTFLLLTQLFAPSSHVGNRRSATSYCNFFSPPNIISSSPLFSHNLDRTPESFFSSPSARQHSFVLHIVRTAYLRPRWESAPRPQHSIASLRFDLSSRRAAASRTHTMASALTDGTPFEDLFKFTPKQLSNHRSLSGPLIWTSSFLMILVTVFATARLAVRFFMKLPSNRQNKTTAFGSDDCKASSPTELRSGGFSPPFF